MINAWKRAAKKWKARHDRQKQLADGLREESDLYLMGMEANGAAVRFLNEVKAALHDENKKLRMHINEHAPGTLPPELR